MFRDSNFHVCWRGVRPRVRSPLECARAQPASTVWYYPSLVIMSNLVILCEIIKAIISSFETTIRNAVRIPAPDETIREEMKCMYFNLFHVVLTGFSSATFYPFITPLGHYNDIVSTYILLLTSTDWKNNTYVLLELTLHVWALCTTLYSWERKKSRKLYAIKEPFWYNE